MGVGAGAFPHSPTPIRSLRRPSAPRASRRDRPALLPRRLRGHHQAGPDPGDLGRPRGGAGHHHEPAPRVSRDRLPRGGVRAAGSDRSALDHRSHRWHEELRPPYPDMGRCCSRSRRRERSPPGVVLNPVTGDLFWAREGRRRVGQWHAAPRVRTCRRSGGLSPPLEPPRSCAPPRTGPVSSGSWTAPRGPGLRRLLRVLPGGAGQGGDLRGGRPQALGRGADEDPHRGSGRPPHRLQRPAQYLRRAPWWRPTGASTTRYFACFGPPEGAGLRAPGRGGAGTRRWRALPVLPGDR